MTAIVATLSAMLFGTADFLGGLASRRERALMVTVHSQVISFCVLLVASLVVPAVVDSRDVFFAVLAGISGGTGVVSLYAGLATGRMGVVAPVTAALSGTLPAAFDLVRGTYVPPLGIAGIALALVAVIIVSVTGHRADETGTAGRALVFACLAGVGFAGSLTAFSATSPDSGIWPLVGARVTTLAMLGSVALFRFGLVRPAQAARTPTLFAGLFDGLATISIVTAIRLGPLAVASVLGALYPVMTVILARYVLDERLHVWQQVGVVLALIAVVVSGLA